MKTLKKYKSLPVLFLLLLLQLPSYAQDTVKIIGDKHFLIGKNISWLEDPQNNFTVKEALSLKFTYVPIDVHNLGITASSYWLKLNITNNTNADKVLLELAQATTDEVIFMQLKGDSVIRSDTSGDMYVFNKRSYPHHHYIFDVLIGQGESASILLKVRTNEQLQVPVYAGTEKSIFQSLLLKDIFAGIYFGIILVMLLYNLALYFTVKGDNKEYLYYVIYIFIVGLTQATLQGYSFKYFFANWPWMANESVYISSTLVGPAAVLFMRQFLNTARNIPRLDKGFFIAFILYGISLSLSLAGIYRLSYLILQIAVSLTATYMLILSVILYRKKIREAKFFLFAWVVFLVGVFIFVLRDFGILPYNDFTYYIMQIGSALEAVMLSIALADKINVLRRDKEASQAEALEAVKENAKIISEQNVMLEQKVEERTEKLQVANTNLSGAIKDLKEAQAQLVSAEKMASLGQLTAGIAHEINNPINFVSSNIRPLKMDIEDMYGLLDLYDQTIHKDDKESHLKEIEKYKTKIDLDFLKTEINTLLEGIAHGASRTAEIVKGLRLFSRLDESDLKFTDIQEGIDSTLIILKSELGNDIEIIKDYNLDKKIECYPGKMNQVFMNILNNAVQALKECHNKKCTITITTNELEDGVEIRIKDNGPGIPDYVKARIFEPFFTTKDVGHGTGLGLSIVYQIIESHNGTIRVESEPDKMTEFIITLPRHQPS
ncbi:MAG: GHKL domain-containing protein [Bacteroidia bacterium]|nr:GHKL domain-containing protein [Bacteroidia bacterium]